MATNNSYTSNIVPLLRSRDLMPFVDGTSECPPKNVARSTAVNLAYSTWVQQDQLILSWINSSLTSSVLSTMSRNQTSRTTWQALEHKYASTSYNRILHLLEDDELVQIIMYNLEPAYEMIVSAVQAHDTPITCDTLEALLLKTE
ncbi:hypothetical protein L3X38_010549 [Prunus dulcis]|uniref:Uncharacterized protein n=1 Tax=Prunus dulcis TaxID=3755 RepID=A0AAD4WGI9_PRUDU|nr:hypothetical protein L3X38_010549 [Prunus dulcis]